jgi:hypothetical protein
MVHQQVPGASAAWDEIALASVALTRAGVKVEAGQTMGTPPPAPDSLEALRRIEQGREQGVALLAALEQLLPLAEQLDRARGDWVGDMAAIHLGETPGTNYAEAVQELHLKLKLEMHGAKGGGRE